MAKIRLNSDKLWQILSAIPTNCGIIPQKITHRAHFGAEFVYLASTGQRRLGVNFSTMNLNKDQMLILEHLTQQTGLSHEEATTLLLEVGLSVLIMLNDVEQTKKIYDVLHEHYQNDNTFNHVVECLCDAFHRGTL